MFRTISTIKARALLGVVFSFAVCNSYSANNYIAYNENTLVKFHANNQYLLNTWHWQYQSDTNQLHVYDSLTFEYLPNLDEANGTANIDLIKAWQIQPSAPNVRVAVIDTEEGDIKHLTTVASIIEQVAAPSILMYDVGDGYAAGLVGETTYCSNVTSAINMAVLNGCKTINLSFGYTGSKAPTNVLTAIANNPSTLFVVAALNGDGPQDTSRDWIPNAHLPNVVCVNSFNKAGECFYSGVGTNVTIAGPGRRVIVQINGTNYSTSGTSYATPHVTGVVALMQAAHPSWPVSYRIQRLKDTATTNAYWQGKNQAGGMLNAYRAISSQPKLLAKAFQKSVGQAAYDAFNFSFYREWTPDGGVEIYSSTNGLDWKFEYATDSQPGWNDMTILRPTLPDMLFVRAKAVSSFGSWTMPVKPIAK